jgi:hypothetical protein
MPRQIEPRQVHAPRVVHFSVIVLHWHEVPPSSTPLHSHSEHTLHGHSHPPKHVAGMASVDRGVPSKKPAVTPNSAAVATQMALFMVAPFSRAPSAPITQSRCHLPCLSR